MASFQCASSAAVLLETIHKAATSTTSTNRLLVLWDIDDTLLATHSTLGPRRRQIFSNEEMETLFQTTIGGECVVDNILLSQGTVRDAVESPGSLLHAPAMLTGLSYPTTTTKSTLKTIVKIVPTITSTSSSLQATTYLSVVRGGPASLVGISLTNLGRASPPSPNVAHLDSTHISKIDIAISFANNGSWGKVVFVDNSLLELGVAQPGPPRKMYTEAPLEDFENDDIQEMFTGRLLQLKLLQTHYAGTNFDTVVSRLQCVHLRIPSSSSPNLQSTPVHHKIFPGEFGCNDERYAYFIKQFRSFCEYGTAKGELLQLTKDTQIISLSDDDNEDKPHNNYYDAISTELKRIVGLINTFRVANLESIIVHCAESDGVDDASTRQTLKSSAAELHRQLYTSRYCNPNTMHPLLLSLHTLVFDTAGGETIPSDSIFELNGLCLTHVQNMSHQIDFDDNDDDVKSKAAASQGGVVDPTTSLLPDWSLIVRVWRPEEGSSAFFVELSNGYKYVIKGSMNIASELFANLLMCAVGIRVPQCRLVAWPSGEWDALKLCIKTTLEQDPSQHSTLRFANRVMNRSVMLVQEFIEIASPKSSTVLSAIIGGGQVVPSSSSSTNTKEEGMDDDDIDKYSIPVDHHIASLSDSLGRIVAADAILNNSDRIPVGKLWNNDGNIGNILISHCVDVMGADNTTSTSQHPLRFIPIDNQFVPLGEPYFSDYTKKLNELNCNATEMMEKVSVHMQEQFGMVLNTETMKRAFHDSCSKIRTVLESSSCVDDLIKVLRGLVEFDWENYWRGNVMGIAQHTSNLLLSAQAVSGGQKQHLPPLSLNWESIYRFWTLPSQSPTPPSPTPLTTTESIKVCIAASPSCNVHTLAKALHAFAASSPYSPLPNLVLFAEGTAAQSNIFNMMTLSKAYPRVFMVLGSYGVLHKKDDDSDDVLFVQRCVTVRNGCQVHVYDKQFLSSGVARVKGGQYDYCMKEPLLSTKTTKTSTPVNNKNWCSEPISSEVDVDVGLATVICRDVEDREVMGSLLDARRGPLVVASPIKLGGAKSTLHDCGVAISLGTRKLEHVAAATSSSSSSHMSIHFIRADVKFPVGLGNSQIVTPHFTIMNGDPQAEHLFYQLPLALSTSENSCPFSSHRNVFRSLPSDDIGKRITVRSTPLSSTRSGEKKNKMVTAAGVELRWLCGYNAIVAVDIETSVAVSDALNLWDMSYITIKGATICEGGYIVAIESNFVLVRQFTQRLSLITVASIQLAVAAKCPKIVSVKIEHEPSSYAPSYLSISGLVKTENNQTLRFGMLSSVSPYIVAIQQQSEPTNNNKTVPTAKVTNIKSLGKNITAELSNSNTAHGLTLHLSKLDDDDSRTQRKSLTLPSLISCWESCGSPNIWAISENRLVVLTESHAVLYEVEEGRSPSSWGAACF